MKQGDDFYVEMAVDRRIDTAIAFACGVVFLDLFEGISLARAPKNAFGLHIRKKGGGDLLV